VDRTDTCVCVGRQTGHGFDHYFGIPFSVDMGLSAWSPNGEFPPLPLVLGDAVHEQPANLDTLSVRYAAFAEAFIANATAAKTPFLLYLAFQHVRPGSPHVRFGDARPAVTSPVGWLMACVRRAGAHTGLRVAKGAEIKLCAAPSRLPRRARGPGI
jgi:hypothetical protein